MEEQTAVKESPYLKRGRNSAARRPAVVAWDKTGPGATPSPDSILTVAPAAIGLVRHRIFDWVNDRMLHMVGYSKDELIGKSHAILYKDPEEFERVDKLKHSRLDDAGHHEIDTVWRRKDGGIIDVHLRSAPVNPEDLSAGITFSAFDITRRKMLEDERLRLEQLVQKMHRFESLGVLAAGLSHEFNNLLMVIQGNASLIWAKLDETALVRENIDNIITASRRAADLCKQMLTYAGQSRCEKQQLDLSEQIRQMGGMLGIRVPGQVSLRFTLTEMLPLIEAGVDQLRQICMSLVTNAVEAIGSSKSGVITVATGMMICDRAYLDDTYLPGNLKPGPYVYIEVSDTGCGMDVNIRARIFDPFFSTRFPGRGLGMSAVLGIVRHHRGAIRLDSEKGTGTTIRILFPTVGKELPEAAASGEEEVWRGEGSVLLVDDDENLRIIGKDMLERIGFSVLTAENGGKALDFFRAKAEKINCVVLDYVMPGMNSEDICLELRRIRPDVKVIMASGYSDNEFRQWLLDKAVIAGFLAKPYCLDSLRAELKRVLDV